MTQLTAHRYALSLYRVMLERRCCTKEQTYKSSRCCIALCLNPAYPLNCHTGKILILSSSSTAETTQSSLTSCVTTPLNTRFSLHLQRINELDQRLSVELEKIRSEIITSGNRELGHWDMAEYRINANRELIEHRTRRFSDELKRVTAELSADILEVKGFLAKTTEFRIRDHGE